MRGKTGEDLHSRLAFEQAIASCTFCAFELAIASCTPFVPFVPFVAKLPSYVFPLPSYRLSDRNKDFTHPALDVHIFARYRHRAHISPARIEMPKRPMPQIDIF